MQESGEEKNKSKRREVEIEARLEHSCLGREDGTNKPSKGRRSAGLTGRHEVELFGS